MGLDRIRLRLHWTRFEWIRLDCVLFDFLLEKVFLATSSNNIVKDNFFVKMNFYSHPSCYEGENITRQVILKLDKLSYGVRILNSGFRRVKNFQQQSITNMKWTMSDMLTYYGKFCVQVVNSISKMLRNKKCPLFLLLFICSFNGMYFSIGTNREWKLPYRARNTL